MTDTDQLPHWTEPASADAFPAEDLTVAEGYTSRYTSAQLAELRGIGEVDPGIEQAEVSSELADKLGDTATSSTVEGPVDQEVAA